MRLKEYQERALDDFSTYLMILAGKREADAKARKTLSDLGQDGSVLVDPVIAAWADARKVGVAPIGHDWRELKDGKGALIPHVCLKVPTGGGKTLLATHAVERFFADHERRSSGLVVWITPSDAIFQQTWTNLRDRDHPYRQVLDRASGGRVKLLQKLERLTPLDLESQLCVLVMMLQSANRATKETLRVFSDNGEYAAFFPSDDPEASAKIFERTPNLDLNDLADAQGPLVGPSIKTSLGNVLRLLRPMIVLDEGHRAYSDGARATLAGLNPSFMLELSATPDARRSNIVVNVTGKALKDEEMIKLPIELRALQNADWKATLAKAWEQTEALQAKAEMLRGRTGRYIRPIMLVRVDRTGKDQRDNVHVHAEDVRQELTQKLGLPLEAVRVQTADVKELKGEDLLSEYSSVRVIITKDALREGWDCAFAYVLAILSPTTAQTALTQMIGRVLRQPYAKATGDEALDSSWVYCFDKAVSDAVDHIAKGLESEGLGDIAEHVHTGVPGDAVVREIIKRREKFRGREILLPRVRHKNGDDWREIDYERDILAPIDWEQLTYRKANSVDLDGLEKAMEARAQVDIEDDLLGDGEIEGRVDSAIELEDRPLDRSFLIRQLLDVVPNPWQGARIVDATLATLRERDYDQKTIARTRLALVGDIKRDLREQVDAEAEALFRAKVEKGDITFRLVGRTPDDWAAPHEIRVTRTPKTKKLTRKAGQEVQLSLFEPLYEDGLNDFEREVALYLDEHDAVQWWHRIAARTEWGIQGWMRHKVYPDFLCWLEHKDGAARMMALEAKGKHLEGNLDTKWKRKLFEMLEELYEHGVDCGEVDIVDPQAKEMRFRILMSTQDGPGWRTDIASALAAA